MIRKRSNSVVGLDPLDELVKSKEEEEKLNLFYLSLFAEVQM